MFIYNTKQVDLVGLGIYVDPKNGDSSNEVDLSYIRGSTTDEYGIDSP